MNEYIKSLMGQFTVESMTGGISFNTSDFNLLLDDDIGIAHFQNLGGKMALQSKGFILSDIAEPSSMAGLVSTAIKSNIQDGIKTGAFRRNKTMKHLFELREIDILASHIAMLTAHSILKDVPDINNISREVMQKFLSPEAVAIPLGFYELTTVMGNPFYNINSFNMIFAYAWHNYYQTSMAKLMMIKMAGNNWKSQFSGCLFDS